MSRVCSISLGLAVWLTSLADVHADEAKTPSTDLYGDPLPIGAVARLGMARGLEGQIHPDELTFSTDGKKLISCSHDGQVRFCDAATGELLRVQRLSWQPGKEMNQFELLALSPDGTTVAGGDYERKRVYQYDTATGKERGWLPASIIDSKTSLLTFSPDGKLLLIQRWEKNKLGAPEVTQFLWDVAGNESIHPGKSLSDCGTLYHVAFTPDGKHLFGMSAVGDDLVLCLWDAATGKPISEKSDTFPGPLHTYPHSLAFAPDGKTLAVAASLEQLHLVDAKTLRKKAILKPPPQIKGDRLIGPLFSPDGRLLAAICRVESGRSQVLLWDTKSWKVRHLLPGEVAAESKLAFAPDGQTLAAFGAWSHDIRMWDVASGRQRNPQPGHKKDVRVVAVSPDGNIIASAGGDELRLWDARTSKTLHVLEMTRSPKDKDLLISEANAYAFWHLLFTSDGKRLISVSLAGVIQMWDVATGTELRRFAAKRRFQIVYALGLSADGKRLMATAEEDGEGQGGSLMRLYVWDADTGKLLSQRPYRMEILTSGDGFSRFAVDRTAFAPDGERISVWLGIEEVATGDLLATLPKGLGRRMAFSPDGRLLAATREQWKKGAYTEKDLSLIESISGEEIFRLEIGEIEHFAFTPEGCGVIVADKEGRLSLWSTFTSKCLYQMAWRDHWPKREIPPEDVCALAVLPGGRAVTGMSEGDIFVWELKYSARPLLGRVGEFDRKTLEVLWRDLGSDAGRAYRAIYQMTTEAGPTVLFLKDHLHPTAQLDSDRIEKLLADLNSDSFQKREAASGQLTHIRYRADVLMRRALNANPSLEMRLRLQAILAQPKRPPTEAIRTLRAIAILERIGTPEARGILKKLADGARAPETQAAQAALQRLKQQVASAKETSTP